jgi:hypothetical protein
MVIYGLFKKPSISPLIWLLAALKNIFLRQAILRHTHTNNKLYVSLFPKAP